MWRTWSPSWRPTPDAAITVHASRSIAASPRVEGAVRMTKIGFIGLGSQGGPMARRIVESGYPLVLWARRAEALAPFADTAAETASSVADLAGRAEHVGVCVVDDAGVEQVCDELIPAMGRGGRIAIHSTVHPKTVVELARRAAARGLALIDAPVSG